MNQFSSSELKRLFARVEDSRSDTHDTLRCKRCSYAKTMEYEQPGTLHIILQAPISHTNVSRMLRPWNMNNQVNNTTPHTMSPYHLKTSRTNVSPIPLTRIFPTNEFFLQSLSTRGGWQQQARCSSTDPRASERVCVLCGQTRSLSTRLRQVRKPCRNIGHYNNHYQHNHQYDQLSLSDY